MTIPAVVSDLPCAGPCVGLFVYGTLRPGDVRWPLLAPFVADGGVDDAVAGRLYDTGRDYPAAIFGGQATVAGLTFRLDPARIDAALTVLDTEEDLALGSYRRVRVTTRRGVAAWAYEYGTGFTLTPIASGDWFHR